MLNHVHLLMTPGQGLSISKCMQAIKGGFSFRVKQELGLNFPVWQRGFADRRIRNRADYMAHVRYIHENPVKERLSESPEGYVYSSATGTYELDSAPEIFRG